MSSLVSLASREKYALSGLLIRTSRPSMLSTSAVPFPELFATSDRRLYHAIERILHGGTSNLSARRTVVNLLETLYVLTAVLLVAAGVQFARGKRTASRHLLWLGILGAGVSLLLY